jgi:hypothetical protein
MRKGIEVRLDPGDRERMEAVIAQTSILSDHRSGAAETGFVAAKALEIEKCPV